MSVEIRFVDEAIAELDDAIDWYEQQRSGLGLGFLATLDRTIGAVERWPRAAPPIPQVAENLEIRQARVGSFPYLVAYMIVDDIATVLAVAHERRRPQYWSGRTTS